MGQSASYILTEGKAREGQGSKCDVDISEGKLLLLSHFNSRKICQ